MNALSQIFLHFSYSLVILWLFCFQSNFLFLSAHSPFWMWGCPGLRSSWCLSGVLWSGSHLKLSLPNFPDEKSDILVQIGREAQTITTENRFYIIIYTFISGESAMLYYYFPLDATAVLLLTYDLTWGLLLVDALVNDLNVHFLPLHALPLLIQIRAYFCPTLSLRIDSKSFMTSHSLRQVRSDSTCWR